MTLFWWGMGFIFSMGVLLGNEGPEAGALDIGWKAAGLTILWPLYLGYVFGSRP